MADKPFPFTVQFTARNPVDPDSGVIPGVTVAEVGVATGHFAFLDRDNKVLGVGGLDDAGNFKTAARRVPLCMDAKSLDTVVAAGKVAKRVKAREDHDDSVGARAGYVANFRMEDGKAVCDATIFDGYRNRAVFMETAAETPELIGLSGDFKFTADVQGDCAFMRVVRIDAVDIVDKGALTHAGLFAAIVDTPDKKETKLSLMAKSKNDADEAPDMDAFKVMCEQVGAYAAKHNEFKTAVDDCMAAIKPVTVPTPPGAPAPVKPDANVNPEAKLALKKELTEELSATFSALVETSVSKAVEATKKEFQQQMSALGLKPTATKEPTEAEKAEAIRLAAELAAKNAPQDFLTLRASVAKEKNISLTAAAKEVMSTKPDVYRAYQVKLGIIKAA